MNIKTIFKAAGAGTIALFAVACGQASDGDVAAAAETTAAEPTTMAHHGHAGHEMADKKVGDMDHGAGKVVEVDAAGRRIKLDHGALPGIGMDAMTMFFGVAGDVDVESFAPGDDVRFMVKKGRDGSFRIMAMCGAAADGDDCLSAHMDHSDH